MATKQRIGPVERALERMSGNQLCRKSGASRSTISRLLNGERNPSVKMLRLIADTLDVSMDDLDQYLRSIKSDIAA